MAHVEDRWTRPTGLVDARGRSKRERTERWGRGLRYLAMWDEDGARKSKSFSTKDAAEAHLGEIARGQRDGTHVRSHKVTLGEYGRAWVDAQIHHRPSTRDQMMSRWRNHIEPELGARELRAITRPMVQAAVQKWSETLAPATIQVAYGYLAAMMKSAVHDRMIAATPCVKINLPKIEKDRVIPLTVAEVWGIADAMHHRLRGMVILAAATGMRPGELRGLTVDRVTFHDDGPTPVLPTASVRIDRQLVRTGPTFGPPKTPRSDRLITIDGRTAAELREHIRRYPQHPTGLIFTSRTGAPLSRRVAADAWHAATVGVPLPDRNGWHVLRHHHASLLIAAGLSVTAVADRLGHQDPTETLRTYAHLWPNDEQRARDAVAAGLWVTAPERSG